ncbi:hypothetical protein [Tolypothrix sp. VBCCA 56010]|uniref:hypothetical protein n=1 Tax=Tolypothrix sp. VBCCA 56010 TaxID=3137731 RepID=UPI003D7DDA1A
MGETTAGASSRETRPTHCLPLALASPFGRRPRWLTTNNADGHLLFLRRTMPDVQLKVVFDVTEDT